MNHKQAWLDELKSKRESLVASIGGDNFDDTILQLAEVIKQIRKIEQSDVISVFGILICVRKRGNDERN